MFPSVVKAGIGFGGEYGEGLLIIRGRPGGYYNLVSASFGFQLGVQERSVIIMFMTNEALAGFEASAGWKVGVDGSVAIVTVGAGGSIDTDKIIDPPVRSTTSPRWAVSPRTARQSRRVRLQRALRYPCGYPDDFLAQPEIS